MSVFDEAYSTFLYLKYNPQKNLSKLQKFENIIATDAEASYFYSLEVIGGRWEKGEKIIGSDSWYSLYYAINILKGPFYPYHYSLLVSENRDKYIEGLVKLGYKELVIEFFI